MRDESGCFDHAEQLPSCVSDRFSSTSFSVPVWAIFHLALEPEVRVVSWHISVQDVYAVLYSSIIMLGKKE